MKRYCDTCRQYCDEEAMFCPTCGQYTVATEVERIAPEGDNLSFRPLPNEL